MMYVCEKKLLNGDIQKYGKWERSRTVWGLDSKCLRPWPVMRKER